MASASSEHDAGGGEVRVALVLDHPPNALTEEKLVRLVAYLRGLGTRHLSLVGAGVVQPENWLLGFEPSRRIAIAPNSAARHFTSSGFGLVLLPAGSGRAVVATAVRVQEPAAVGHGELSIKELDAQIEHIAGPSPDLIIVAGETPNLRGSFTWQAAYGELVFVRRSWTELTLEDLDRALKEFAKRGRRFGGVA